MNVLPQFFYVMVVIGSLSMEGDGGGCGGCWDGVAGGRWEWEGVGEGRIFSLVSFNELICIIRF